MRTVIANERTSQLPLRAAQPPADGRRVSVVIPCLDEADSIERCVQLARAAMEEHELAGEVVVVDNGSTDGSAELATRAGARVVHEARRGYGSAYLAGFAAAEGEYVIMADADLTYDFAEIPRFVAELEGGADFVIGNRMKHIHPGAMPWLHRYVGNPALTGILNLFYRSGVQDAHCGMRAIRAASLESLELRATGMEFASEMVVRAAKCGLTVRQLQIEYHPRGGRSKLSSFRDGWRHLRFLLVHCPTYLFMLPGALIGLAGAVLMLTVIAQIDVFGRVWQLHSMIGGSLLVIVGSQIVSLGLCAHAYGTYYMGERDPWFDRLRARFNLEHGLLLGGALLATGLVVAAVIFGLWVDHGLGNLREERLLVLAATFVIVGVQVFFSSFLLSILGLRRQA